MRLKWNVCSEYVLFFIIFWFMSWLKVINRGCDFEMLFKLWEVLFIRWMYCLVFDWVKDLLKCNKCVIRRKEWIIVKCEIEYF